LPKKHQKDAIFLEKSQNTYYFARPNGGVGGGKSPLLPSPADAHVLRHSRNNEALRYIPVEQKKILSRDVIFDQHLVR